MNILPSINPAPITSAMFSGTQRPSGSASFKRPGNRTANKFPACSPEKCESLATASRQQIRRHDFNAAMLTINQVAGGEPRKTRRAMARAKAKNIWKAMRAKELAQQVPVK